MTVGWTSVGRYPPWSLPPGRRNDDLQERLVFSGIGPTELIIVLVIVLIIFGPKRLPDLGRSLGTGMRQFKDSVSGKDEDRDLPAADKKPEPVRAEASEARPAGGQSS
jgi:sec-independent protein translocase protein TatA